MERSNASSAWRGKLIAAICGAALAGTPASAVTTSGWLAKGDMHKAFSGKTIAGRYAMGLTFKETYWQNGTIDYADELVADKGNWRVTGQGFCTFYITMNGGCFAVRTTGSNCFEFYIVEEQDSGARTDRSSPRFVAHGWYPDKPSTCVELSS